MYSYIHNIYICFNERIKAIWHWIWHTLTLPNNIGCQYQSKQIFYPHPTHPLIYIYFYILIGKRSSYVRSSQQNVHIGLDKGCNVYCSIPWKPNLKSFPFTTKSSFFANHTLFSIFRRFLSFFSPFLPLFLPF